MLKHSFIAIASALALIPVATQAQTYASGTDTFLRGSAPGDFTTFYGGTLAAFPVALTDAEAKAAVLGGPDGTFLSLPGVGPQPSGSAFGGAYIEVTFGGNFGIESILTLYEIGNNSEQAQLFLWGNNGGNIQPLVQTNNAGVITVDLRDYAAQMALIGATSFTKVGIGGFDTLGASQGFDLDAVSITPVPEPSTYALMLAGLGVIGWVTRRRPQR